MGKRKSRELKALLKEGTQDEFLDVKVTQSLGVLAEISWTLMHF